MTPLVEKEKASCHDPKSLRCRRGSCVVCLSRCVCWCFFLLCLLAVVLPPDRFVFFLTLVGCSSLTAGSALGF